jgi:hypothetical protein
LFWYWRFLDPPPKETFSRSLFVHYEMITLSLGPDGTLHEAKSQAPLTPEELDDLVRLAILWVRTSGASVDDLWLELNVRGVPRAVHLMAMNDSETCMLDIHDVSHGVAIADQFLVEGLHIPWIVMESSYESV